MDYDICVLGAGPAGLIAMLRFASAGFRVLGIERNPKSKSATNDQRSTAFLLPAVKTLKHAHIWPAISQKTVALKKMQIIDIAQSQRKALIFDATEIRQKEFARNISNIDLVKALNSLVRQNPNIEIRYQDEINNFNNFEKFVEVKLTNGDLIRTRLLIGADGRNSKFRDRLKFSVKRYDFSQTALAFTVTHEKPHNNISTEIHSTGGPFTTVPNRNIDGNPTSAIVWLDAPELQEIRKSMNSVEFEENIFKRSAGILGKMKLVSEIGAFSIIGQKSDKMHDHRCVIIGEAAHVVPPIGAQGLNMSLRDIESLVKTCEAGALKEPKHISSWAAARKRDIDLRSAGISTLNHVSIANFTRANQLRRLGLWALDKETPLRHTLMKLGLGSNL